MTQDIFNEILSTKDDTIAILKSTIEDYKVLIETLKEAINEKDELIATLESGSSAKSASVVSMEGRMMDEYSWMMKGAA